MNNMKYLLLFVAVLSTLSQCHLPNPQSTVQMPLEEAGTNTSSTEISFDFYGNGKDKDSKDIELNELYTETDVNESVFPDIDQSLLTGLKKQLKLLQYRKNKEYKNIPSVDITTEKLIQTIKAILGHAESGDQSIFETLTAHQIKGEDNRGNVFFTGYFTPVIKVSKEKTGRYKYPLYAKPKKMGIYPSRAQIDGEGVLEGLGLELAYAENLADIYFMQVQGSGIVEYENGAKELFAYGGRNKHPYKSIGKYMIRQGLTTAEKVSLSFIKRYLSQNPDKMEEVLFANPSYVFFDRVKYQQTPKGAGQVNLTEDYSIAADPKYIPLGSCLLAAVPIINKNNRVIKHEYRVLIAQDTGGAIKGPGHIDLYMGPGTQGRKKASALHHYGKLWLLLPTENDVVKPLASL